MTNNGDVIRQIETLKSDNLYPPNHRQRETFDRILFTVVSGSADSEGSR